MKKRKRKKNTLNTTTKSQIKSSLRHLWLRSRERAAALKREGYCCERCGIKQSMARGKEVKVQVHHRELINWEAIFRYLRRTLLCRASKLEVLCTSCHNEHHYGEKK